MVRWFNEGHLLFIEELNMATRLNLTTEYVKLTIAFFGAIGGLTLRVFMTHYKLSKV